VLGYEKVRVPAGEFDAFKLEAQGTWESPQAPFPGAADEIYWYAPAVRAIVKKEHQATGMPTDTDGVGRVPVAALKKEITELSCMSQCMSLFLMLWTAPPPARECQRWGRR
jgi:hypothetical protein